MFGGLTIQGIFLVVIGAAILVVGTTSLRRQMRIKLGNFVKQAKILTVNHVAKKDDEGYLIQNYYDVKIEFDENGKKQQKAIKCIDQYEKGDMIKIIKDTEKGGGYRAYGNDKIGVFAPLILIVSSILIICMPFVQIKFGDSYMSVLLAVLLALVGFGLIISYYKAMSRQLESIDAEIYDILKWKSGQKKKWTNETVSYYPIIKYTVSGKDKFIRSRYNSSSQSSYKKGKKLVIYRDLNTGDIVEKRVGKSMLIGGIALVLFAGVGLYSSLMIIMG